MIYLFLTLIILLAIPLALMLWLRSNYNRMIILDQRCDAAFADIDVHLKHRADIIPSLVETVKDFASHEQTIISDVVQARATAAQSTTAGRLEAETALGRKINSVITLSEKYPQLEASSHFRDMRTLLMDTENRITASRRFFNLAVAEYNATMKQFPSNMIASKCHMVERNPYSLGVERVLLDEAPMVKFA